jgi:HEAT repeat protein
VRRLLNLLRDDHFLVRRTAVRALGQIGDPMAVTPLLDAVTADPALVRDVVAALQRIGPEASPHLRRDLEHLVTTGHRGRRGALVATALGLHGDIASAPTLVRALVAGTEPALRAAAAEALGEIGVPIAVPALVAALADADPEVRRQAATALGQVSDTSAVPAIAAVLGSGQHEVDRALAGALLSLGPAGMAALAGHASPYAREALSLRQMRITA